MNSPLTRKINFYSSLKISLNLRNSFSISPLSSAMLVDLASAMRSSGDSLGFPADNTDDSEGGVGEGVLAGGIGGVDGGALIEGAGGGGADVEGGGGGGVDGI